MYLKGVIQSFGVVFISSFFFVYIRYFSLNYNIDAVVFTLISMIAAALTLSLFAGPGKYIASTLKSWDTWFYGFLLIGTYIVDIILVESVTGTETGLLNRLTIPFSLVFAYMFLKRTPSKANLLGNAVILIGFFVLINYQGIEAWHNIWLPVLLVVLFNGGSFIVAETHKEYTKAHEIGNLRDKMRVVAFVSFVTSMIFLIISVYLTYLKLTVSYLSTSPILVFVPAPDAYIHAPSIISGVVYGLIFAPLSRYFIWSASQNIKSENVLAILSIIPIVTLVMEWVISQVTGSVFIIHEALIIAAILISFGAMLPIVLKVREEHKGGTSMWKNIKAHMKINKESLVIKHSSVAIDDYEIVRNTIEFTDGDTAKVGELLNLSENTIIVLNQGKGSLALVESESKNLARRYRKHVANSDALTGLVNRSGFMVALKSEIEKKSKFTVLFLDLDKFKPVNDTYGHDAGDDILKEVAMRLKEALPKSSVIARIGGDEFVALLKCDKYKVLDYSEDMVVNITRPFNLTNSDDPVCIGVSVGTASYPDDAKTAKGLLKFADTGMYVDKDPTR
ncbi:MAG: diguanylate cyclase (GGDEF)-like protein [Alphaproteobacteria bacterium]|jgi:diguanylate cyclase (GGDEF)-like protein